VYLVKTPAIVRPLSSQLKWKVQGAKNEVYLTFDDGPTPGVTAQVLDILDSYEAKATFFCIGGNAQRHHGLYAEICKRGHSTGNHTWNHMDGWAFSDYSYYKNVLECSQWVDSNLFRPPYGRITRSQARGISKRYSIVMWDVLSADWRKDVSPEQCLQNVTAHSTPGSIVVFHDSEKASRNMLYALPRALEFWRKSGLKVTALKQENFLPL
jgi:peptidoglycan/xylan/chitin deacetylase (PgdA/CDA1 family)